MNYMQIYRVQIRTDGDPEEQRILNAARDMGVLALDGCRSWRVYHIKSSLSREEVLKFCENTLVAPVTDTLLFGLPSLPSSQSSSQPPGVSSQPSSLPPGVSSLPPGLPTRVLEASTLAGVTDVAARELERAAEVLGLPPLQVCTARRYELSGEITDSDMVLLTRRLLVNATIERSVEGELEPIFFPDSAAAIKVERVCLSGLSDEELLCLSRRRTLSLDLDEMKAIRAYFHSCKREPTDAELETLAQTWSEHCVHKTFRAHIQLTHTDVDGNVHVHEIDGLLNLLKDATAKLDVPWIRSAFTDNAGIVAFDDNLDLAIKVETHNHPSALEPFGGANTGIGGVVRDIMGVSARPVACTDVLCFGYADMELSSLPEGVLHPRRIREGVVAGVGDYGNKLGLPTVNGAVVYDACYVGNPLVFCGAVGLLPRGSHPTSPQAGDRIISIGGRTGRDGIHGATFSSAVLDAAVMEHAGSAVQIGDPITQKGCIEVVERARDARLYHAITDCGAGGFSSAVCEMGADLGAEVDLAQAPLKYPGLQPWEIWVSEAQERMVLAVPPGNVEHLRDICASWDVELSDIGVFTDSNKIVVRHGDVEVIDMPMDFLHNGIPRKTMIATHQDKAFIGSAGLVSALGSTPSEASSPVCSISLDTSSLVSSSRGSSLLVSNSLGTSSLAASSLGNSSPDSAALGLSELSQLGGLSGLGGLSQLSGLSGLLLDLLAHPNVCSRESIVRRYDHEVRGGTVVRPYIGVEADGPSDAAVLKPLGTWQHNKAFALAVGVNPKLTHLNPYMMAIHTIDEAFRNLVCTGADPDTVALLDNFSWGNPTRHSQLGSLSRAVQGCVDGALLYNAPFISGKDSLYNEFEGVAVDGTLVISAIGLVHDMRYAITSALTSPGSDLWMVGESSSCLGGSVVADMLNLADETFNLNAMPNFAAGMLNLDGSCICIPPPVENPLLRYRAVHNLISSGLVTAAHDVSDGGIAVALAEMAIGGRLGLNVAIPNVAIPCDGTDTHEHSCDDTDTHDDADTCVCGRACAVAAFTNEAPGRLILETPISARGKVADALGECGRRIGTVTDTDVIDMRLEKLDTPATDYVSHLTLPADTCAAKANMCIEDVWRVCSVSLDEAKRAFCC